MPIKITPLSTALGAEISGVDLTAPLDKKTAKEINNIWMKYLVIVFRGQQLSDEDQVRFCGYFGSVGTPKMTLANRQNVSTEKALYPTTFVGNIMENGKPIGILPEGEIMFHRDGDYTNMPFKGNTLYAIDVPDQGGNTRFSNQYSVYDALSDDMLEKLDGMDIYNTHKFGINVRIKRNDNHPEVMKHARKVFYRHPATGRMIVTASELMTDKIIGLPFDESRAVLNEIFALQNDPRFVYEHKWQVNDMVMWDNCSTLHARTDFPKEQRRWLRRMAIEGIPLEKSKPPPLNLSENVMNYPV